MLLEKEYLPGLKLNFNLSYKQSGKQLVELEK